MNGTSDSATGLLPFGVPSVRAAAVTQSPAQVDPVALVAVDIPLPHLDRPFEYGVPAALSDAAQPGTRVKVRFAGRDVDGFVLERRPVAEHAGRLTPLRRVVSPEPVLTPTVAGLCRTVADRYAGTLADVLRLAVPARHAAAERAVDAEAEIEAVAAAGPGAAPERGPAPEASSAWRRYPAGASLLRRLRQGENPWAAWTALPTTEPSDDWPAAFAEAAQATLDSGRGCLLVVPDHRDVARVDAALTVRLGPGRHLRLTADLGPQMRYTSWLKVRRGLVRCVVGTRAAAFAPVSDLGLVSWWDDGDDLHAEPRAPYPHVRDVLRLRAQREHAALLVGGYARTTQIHAWVATGELPEVRPAEQERRATVPRTVVAGEGLDEERDGPAAHAHLPGAAWRTARAALERGPVLVQVPRRGYVPAVSCQTCRTPARCTRCRGPLGLTARSASPSEPVSLACGWCGALCPGFSCATCGGARLRSRATGARRTAEELGRAFPEVPVVTSGAGHVRDTVEDTPTLVIATPGAEPVATGGYAAVLLLDAWASLDRPSLAAAEEAVRRWMAAAALCRDRTAGGVVVLCGAPAHATLPAVEALVRWAPEWFAAREYAERVQLALPPATWMAQLTGSPAAIRGGVAALELPTSAEVLGPLPVPPGRWSAPATAGADSGVDGEERKERVVVRCPWPDAPAVTAALSGLRVIRSARKERDLLTVVVGSDLD